MLGTDYDSAKAAAQQAAQERREQERREALAALEQHIDDIVNEDLRKQIPHLLLEIHKESLKSKAIAISPVTRTLARFATLLGALYIRADIQTRRVIRLTWALVGLTVALLFFTAYLAEDAYFNRQRDKAKQSDQAEPNQSDTEIHSTVPY
jgi:hypothetical protein